MRRIYYLLDDINEAHLVSDTLHENGISDWQLQFLAKNEVELHRYHLHEANIFSIRDFIYSGERGALIGLAAGFYLSLFVLPWSVVSTIFLINGLFVFTALGLAIGAVWGNFHKNHKTFHFHNDIENGKLLVMLDAKKGQHALVMNLMKHEFPKLKSADEHDWLINPFENRELVSI